MIVRVVTYEADSLDAAREWHEEHAAYVKEFLGLERVEFLRTAHPPRAGAIMYFSSPEDLRQFKASERFDWLRESIRESWAAEDEPAHESVYRVMEGEGWAREKT